MKTLKLVIMLLKQQFEHACLLFDEFVVFLFNECKIYETSNYFIKFFNLDFFLSKHSKGAVKNTYRGFPGGAVVESLPANAGDTGSSPGLGGSHMPRSN